MTDVERQMTDEETEGGDTTVNVDADEATVNTGDPGDESSDGESDSSSGK